MEPVPNRGGCDKPIYDGHLSTTHLCLCRQLAPDTSHLLVNGQNSIAELLFEPQQPGRKLLSPSPLRQTCDTFCDLTHRDHTYEGELGIKLGRAANDGLVGVGSA